MKLTKKQKREHLIRIGGQLSNLCYKLVNTDKFEKKDFDSMKELQTKWDQAYIDYIGPIRPAKK